MVGVASSTGISRLVSQGEDWKTARIAAFYSAKLNSAQQNYATHEIEMFAEIETMLRHVDIFNCCSSAPVLASHTCTDLSYEPETMWVPSCENATEQTTLVLPVNCCSCAPIEASHTLTELSSEPETMWIPSCEKQQNSPYECGHLNSAVLHLLRCPILAQICLLNQRQF